MKKPMHPVLAATTALTLAFSPVLVAQETAAPDQSQNTRTSDSTADKHADQNGSSASQPGTLDKNNSKDASSQTRDANPSTAETNSKDSAGSKDTSPNAADKDATVSAPMHHHSSDKLTDKEFMTMAAQGGMTEVELGKVAGEKASSDKVKEFGAHMVKDHSAANDELKGLASKKGVTLPDKLDAHHQAMVDKMNKMSGASFDNAYVKGMVRDHEKTVAMFEEESKSGQDPDVKDFATKTLPTLKEHLAMIQGIEGGQK